MQVARIRTIKPEFWTSAQVANCSPTARLLFVGLWNFSDDHGVHPAEIKRAKMEIFPGDPFSADQIAGWIGELISNDLLTEYQVNGCKYWIITGWHHQRIDKPSYKYPLPVGEASKSPTVTLVDGPPADSKGREGKGSNTPVGPQNIWDIGVSLLARTGLTERNARSYLGRLVKDFGEPAVSAAVAQCSTKNPADPCAYLKQTLQATARQDIYTKAKVS